MIADKLKTLVDSAVSKYLILYQECSKGADKNSELYLRWLQYQRTLVCKSLRSSESVVDMEMEEDTSEGTKRTVVTLIMSNVYAGISQQMAKEIEQSYSTNSVENADTSPSDDVALHRICGWALKSVTDNVTQKSKKQSSEHLKEHLRLLDAIKLPNDRKIDLPSPVQYLDRGGLTFMQLNLLPWMRAIEARMVLNLNSSSYQRYGEKLFEVTGKISHFRYVCNEMLFVII